MLHTCTQYIIWSLHLTVLVKNRNKIAHTLCKTILMGIKLVKEEENIWNPAVRCQVSGVRTSSVSMLRSIQSMLTLSTLSGSQAVKKMTLTATIRMLVRLRRAILRACLQGANIPSASIYGNGLKFLPGWRKCWRVLADEAVADPAWYDPRLGTKSYFYIKSFSIYCSLMYAHHVLKVHSWGFIL